LIVDPNPSKLNEPLQGRTRDIPLVIDEKDIEAFWLLSGGDDKFRNHTGTSY
jgi:hypothetical protein